MAATVGDLFTKASSGTRAEATTLTAQKAMAATSISVAALTGWPTDTAVHFQIYRVDTSNKIVPGSQLDLKGIASGTTISQIQYKAGTDDIYPIGSIVVALPTAAWDNDLVTGLLTHADQDGTLKAGAVDNTAVLADGVVTANKIATGSITPAVWTNPYRFSVYRNATAAYSTGSAAIIHDTVLFDPQSNYSTSNGRYTITMAGFYTFQARASVTSSVRSIVSIYKNGVEAFRGYDMTVTGGGGVSTPPIQLAVTDYIQSYLYVGSNTNLEVGQNTAYFGGWLVSQV